jgi:cyclophilin family peptidyl-prolyl cis-trans isomerase/HEAT repeat protein
MTVVLDARRPAPCVIAMVSAMVAAACGTAPAGAPGPEPRLPFEQKMQWILQLEDERRLREASAEVVPQAPPPPPARGRRPTAAPLPPPPRADLVALLADAEARVRRRAALAIGRVRQSEGVAPLQKVLAQDPEPEVRQMAAFALGLIGESGASEALLAALADAEALVQGRAAEALGLIGHQPGASAVVTMVSAHVKSGALEGIAADDLDYPKRPETEAVRLGMYALVRLDAYEQLASVLVDGSGRPVSRWWPVAYAFQRVGNPAAAPVLRQLLEGDGQMTRAFAARGLGVIKDRTSLPALLRVAANAGEALPVRIQAIRAIAAIGDRESAHALARLLRVRDGGPRASAEATAGTNAHASARNRHLQLEVVTALGQLGAADELDVLVDFASDDWPAMRAAALTALAQADPDMFLVSLSGLDPDPHWSVRAALASALGTLGYERAQARLTVLAAETDQRVVPAVLRALTALNAPSAPDVLLERLKSDDFAVRQAAASGLAKLKPAGAAAALEAAVNDSVERDSTYVARAAMLDALVEVDPAAARPILERALGDKDWAIRLRAAELLRKVDPAQPASPARPAPPVPVPEVNALDALVAPPVSPIAYIDTEMGMIEVELAVLDAPRTVANFIALAGKGFFNGLPIHRVVPDFVVQDGDPRGDGEGGPGYTIRDEINQRPYLRGTVGMALDWADTGGSQFFITHSPQPHLDGRYTVFGQVRQGLEIVDQLTRWTVIRTVRVWDGAKWIGR